MRRCVILCLLCVAACAERGAARPAAPGSSASEPAPLPPVPPSGFEPRTPQLPKLAKSIVVDGKIDDWKDAASVPLRSRAQIVQIAAGREWKGPVDLSAEMYAGWTDQGIVMAAVVRDNDLVSDKHGADSWQNDCVELFVDGRGGERLMSDPYTRGAYQLLVRPPISGSSTEVFVIRNEKIDGLAVAGTLSPGGYTIEVLFPWPAFADIQPGPGAKVALAFQVDERDARDAAGRSVTLASPITPDLWRSPPQLQRWQLVSRPMRAMELGPQMLLDVRRVFGAEPPREANVELSTALANRVDQIRLSAFAGNTAGPKIVTSSARVVAASAKVSLPPATWPAGEIMIVGEALDAKAETVGTVGLVIVGIGDALNRALANLRAADVAKLSASEPFRAGAWLGAAAAVSRLREDLAEQHQFTVGARVREVRTRIDLLNGRSVTPSLADLHDLLVVASNPEAQVVVEYPERGLASVTFDYGSIPLGAVAVQDAKTARPLAGGTGVLRVEKKTVLGKPAVLDPYWMYLEPIESAPFDAKADLALWQPKQRSIWALDKADVDKVTAQAAVLLPGADPAVAKTAKAWADKNHVPVVPLGEAAKSSPVLVAGDPRSTPELAGAALRRIVVRTGAVKMTLTSDDRTYYAVAPSAAAAEKMIALVLAAKPITVADVDALRASIVAAIGKGIRPAPAPVVTGDLHMHTFYSDGSGSPVSLALQAMYANQDYSVITDHNTITGAARAHGLLARTGLAYPLIVGEEVTTQYHSVVFPLTERVPPDIGSAELTRKMHERGAYAQWNHPGFPDWGTEHLAVGLPADAFDAWEHLPAHYDAWAKKGKVPLLTGTTDTHDGTFGQQPERTIVFVDAVDGQVLANELRAKRAVAVLPDGGKLFYGPAQHVKKALAALAEGKALKETRARRLRAMLEKANLVDLVLAGETSALSDTQAATK